MQEVSYIIVWTEYVQNIQTQWIRKGKVISNKKEAIEFWIKMKHLENEGNIYNLCCNLVGCANRETAEKHWKKFKQEVEKKCKK